MTVTRKTLENEVKKVMQDIRAKTKEGCFSSVSNRDSYALDKVQIMLSELLSTENNKIIIEF